MSEETIQGKVSVNTENIFPIIKKWLYSEKDIFLRELISNSFDAITKLKKISLTEKFDGDTDYKIQLSFDKDKRTLTIEDNGLGMDSDEIQKYINQIAFSSAEEFVKKFQGEGQNPDIIGHFGLGFYSSFMVSSKVVIESKSYKPNSKAVYWESESGINFSMKTIEQKDRGTKITLFLDADSGEYLDAWKLKDLVKKYCDFLPVPIFVEKDKANKEKPLWTSSPSQLKKEDYIEFYNYLFPFSQEPLFWVHLNVDFPFRVQGILFFPKLKHELDVNQNHIKLYCNNVFVSDEAKDLIPQFLTVLKGTIDIPDLPLNVSRSYLQSDPLISKITQHIIKKVSDKLKEEKNRDENQFLENYKEIAMFLKYGMLTNEKFYESSNELILFPSTTGKMVSLTDYWNTNKDKNDKKVYYVNESDQDSVVINLFKSQGLEAILVDSKIDSHFIQFLETKNPEMKFQRVDSDLTEQLIDKDAKPGILDQNNKSETDKIKELFDKAIGREGLEIKVEALKADDVSGMIIFSEHIRRMTEMNMMMGKQGEDLLKNHTFLINSKSKLIKNIIGIYSGPNTEKSVELAKYVYNLALLSSKQLNESKISNFIKESNQILENLTSGV